MTNAAPRGPATVWNLREQSGRSARSRDPSRPWYRFAEATIRSLGICGGSALDVGCGRGEFLARLQGMGFRVAGCDGQPAYVEDLRREGYDVRTTDLETALPYADASADLIACLEVIEHVARAEDLLAEIRRVLRPGGHLILSTPNHRYWRVRVGHLIGQDNPGEGVHLRFFSRDRLKRLMAERGLDVVREDHFGPVSGVNFLRRRLRADPVDVRIPPCCAGLLAYNLLFGARCVP